MEKITFNVFEKIGLLPARAFEEKLGSNDEFILGVGNHDPQPLKQIAKGIKEGINEADKNK